MLRAWAPPLRQSAPPPLGERNRKLIEDGCIVQAREERLLDIWCRKLRDELLLINAPVLASLQGSLDPDRAALLTGSTRASTLQRYLGYYRQWRLWLGEAKLRQPPGRPSDLVDYLLARRDEPCGQDHGDPVGRGTSHQAGPALSGLYADAAGGLGHRRGARYRLEDLGLGQASQGLGLATVVRPASYHPRGAFAGGGEAHHRAKANQNFGPQPSGKGAAGRYIRARLLPQEHLAKGGFRSAANPR